MSDPADQSDRAPAAADSSSDDSDEQLPSSWAQFRPLVLSLAGSAALHLAVFGLVYWISTLRIDLGAEVEWLDTSDDLSGVGHRITDRFADLGDITEKEEKSPKTAPEEQNTPEFQSDESLENALEGEYEPPEPPEPEPPESEEENSARTRSDASRAPNEPKQEAPKQTDSERGKKTSRAFENVEDHRALDRKGPNNLPDMRSFAPGNARMSALVRVDRVRGQPYEDGVRKILRAVPDYRLLLGVPAFDPVRDMDWFFMASPNPQYVQHTFLAVQHRLSTSRVRELVDRRYPDPPAWKTFQEYPVRALVPEHPEYRDPRRIVLAGEGLAMVAKEKLLPGLVEPLSGDSELLARASDGRGEERPREPREALPPPDQRASLLDGLARIHRVADRDETIILLSARGLVYQMPGVGRLPRFESVRLEVSNPDKPTLNIDLQFQDASRAEQFAGQCPDIRTAIDDAIPFSGALGLSDKLERLDCRAEDAYVNVHAAYTAREVGELADLAYPFLPRPPVLDELPKPPKNAEQGEGTSERGSPDAGASGPSSDAGRGSGLRKESPDANGPRK